VAEGVHQMRVAVRRLRSALAAVKPMLSDGHYAWANGAAKSLTAALGATRDWDVLAHELLPPVIETMPGEQELKQLSRALARQRRAAYRKAKEAIAAPEYTATILRLSRWFEARAWRDQPVSEQSAALVAPIKDLAPSLLARRYRQARKRGKRFKSLSLPERHRLRIALKKLRYSIELLECLFDEKEVQHYLGRIKSLQDNLGYVSDVRTAHAILVPWSAGTGEKGAPQAGGIVLGWHLHRLIDQEKALRARVRRFRRVKAFW
jgi:CHAD domain-containing protein